MITQEDIFGVNMEESWKSGEIEEEVLKGDKKDFITSPADIDPREHIKLRDAEVTPQHREAFENLCSEFEEIFSKDSADLGKTPLLKIDIPTGDSPPMGTRRDRNLRKSGNYSKKCISMGQSHSDCSQEDSSGRTSQKAYVCGLSYVKPTPAQSRQSTL